MFHPQALRRIGAPDKRCIRNGKLFHLRGGLSDRTRSGFSVYQPQLDRDHICLQACRRWYSNFLVASGSRLLDCQNHQIRPMPSKNLLGSCSAVPSPLSFTYTIVRSFAAPVQANQKPKPDTNSYTGPRLNEAITAPFIRLVTDERHDIVPRRYALDRAMKLNLDLVEVQSKSDPPVCKIMDYHKEKFKQEVKEKERAKSKSAVALRSAENKEVRFKGKTELKDLKTKAEAVVRLMERGYRVKCTAMPTGKEGEDLGELLSRLLTLIEDVSVVESGPHVDSKHAYIIVRHMKFSSKKSGKKLSKVTDLVAKGFQGVVSSTSAEVSNTGQEGKALPSEDESEATADDEAQAELNPQRLSHEATASLEDDTKEETEWTELKNTMDARDLFDLDSESGSSSGTPHHKLSVPSASSSSAATEPGLSSLRSVLGWSTSKETSGKDTNRYSKRAETKGKFHNSNLNERSNVAPYPQGERNRARLQEEPLRRGQVHQASPKQQQQFYPNTASLPNPGNSRSPNTTDSSVRGRFGNATVSKTNDTDLSSGNYGNFSSGNSYTGNGRGLANPNIGKPDRGGSLNYGIFSTQKIAPHGELRKSVDEAVSKPRTAPTPTFGNFTTQKPASSSDHTPGDSPSANSSSPRPTPKFGVFISTKTSPSGN